MPARAASLAEETGDLWKMGNTIVKYYYAMGNTIAVQREILFLSMRHQCQPEDSVIGQN